MLHKEVTYGYNDISIKPAKISEIRHRSDCNPLKDGMLPIFTAPMSSVLNLKNYSYFENNSIIPIIPRNISFDDRLKLMEAGKWVALSLKEFEMVIDNYEGFENPVKILIDVANGNMSAIFELSRRAKAKYGSENITLMSGNIANADTYIEYCKAGIDYVRCSIGSGNGCLSTTQTSIHYGIVNLIDEIVAKKNVISKIVGEYDSVGLNGYSEYSCVTKIIADGGIRNYSDVIKALALGADYVMIGGLFAQLIESCAFTYGCDENDHIINIEPLDDNVSITEVGGVFVIEEKKDENTEDNYMLDRLYKRFYGMASKQGQEDLFGKKIKTAEGKEKDLPCTTNIHKWSKNMKDYLSSAMSYCNISNVNDFNNNNVDVYLMSPILQNSINK